MKKNEIRDEIEAENGLPLTNGVWNSLVADAEREDRDIRSVWERDRKWYGTGWQI